MATVAQFGESILFVTPIVNTSDYLFFALATSDSGATQIFDRWHYIGQDGVNMKPMGLGARTGAIVGWIDASSSANLSAGQAELANLVQTALPDTITFAGGMSVYAVATNVTFPRLWGNKTRICADFILTWEEVL